MWRNVDFIAEVQAFIHARFSISCIAFLVALIMPTTTRSRVQQMVMGYLAEEVEAEPPLARAVKPNDLPADWASVVPMIHYVSANIVAREEYQDVVAVEVELQPEFPAQGQAVMDGHITPVLENGVLDILQDFRKIFDGSRDLFQSGSVLAACIVCGNSFHRCLYK